MPNKKINQLDLRTAVSTDLMLVGDPTNGTAYKSTLANLPLVPTSRVLTINGVAFDLSANRAWTIDALPSQTGNSGKYLTTNGTAASWGVIDLSAYVPYTGATGAVNLGANNLTANNVFTGFSTISASGTQVVLTINSVPEMQVTGSGGQTIKLPDATTLANGTTYRFNNNQSSGAILVNNNSNTLVVSVPSGGYVDIVLLSNSIAAGSWDRHDLAPSNVSWSTNTFDYAGSITSATWNGNAVAINRGGTGASTAGGALTNLGAVPTSRTLTINGTSFDLSANRSWTISGDNIYTANGTLTGNRVVTMSGNTINFNGSIGLGISPALIGGYNALNINGTTGGALQFSANGTKNVTLYNAVGSFNILTESAIPIVFGTNLTEKARLTSAGRFLLGIINESTFILDVNGTARVSGTLTADLISASLPSFKSGGIYLQSASTINNNICFNTFYDGTSFKAISTGFTQYLQAFAGSISLIGSNASVSAGSAGTNITYFDFNPTESKLFASKLNSNNSTYVDFVLGNGYDNPRFIKYSYFTGGYSHYLVSRHDSVASSAQNQLTLYINNSTSVGGSSAPTVGNVLSNSQSAISSAFFQPTLFKIGGAVNDVPVTSAALEVISTTKGFRPPTMTTAQKNAIASPAAGLVIFDTTLAKLCVYSGTAWETITSI